MKFRNGLRIFILAVQVIFFCSTVYASQKDQVFTCQRGNLVFQWDLMKDEASVKNVSTENRIWQGSLLPSFWLEVNHKKVFIQAGLTSVTALSGSPEKMRLELQIGELGKGYLIVSKADWGIRFSELQVEWAKTPPAIIEMFFGASDKSVKASSIEPTWDRPFMPDWQSLLFCVPGAKGGTPQSYFRMWDFGQANIALGDFGPSMGSPYGAAYPRPLYFAGMGTDDGFIAFGAGSIPDAAMSLRIQSTRGCFQYVYNENIWGAMSEKKRTWIEPLRITLGSNALLAFKEYYNSFPDRKTVLPPAPKPIWNTWGMWGQGKYVIRPVADFAKKIAANIIVLDDGWQTSIGSGIPDLVKFPHFYEDLAYARKEGIEIGLWESVGWIADPFSRGLKKEDLILNKRGEPCKANWNFNPSDTSFYCLDISSEKARVFIQQRTIDMMKSLKPVVLKLDFAYGLPSPGMGVPRDPKYRGERYGFALFHLIASTAKQVNPDVIIEGYSISPLWLNEMDIVSMDDQGDLWYDMASGHQQWSLWGSLLSDRKVWISGSSGYKWDQDEEAVLNSCILGPPGAVLPIYTKEEEPVPDKYFNRRLAVDHWYRHTLQWLPVWFDSQQGGYTEPIQLNCWGRMEINGKDSALTALVLRGNQASNNKLKKSGNWFQLKDSTVENFPLVGKLKWKGRWALISQDDKNIFTTSALAIIPFKPGAIFLPYAKKPVLVKRLSKEGETIFDLWKWDDGQLIIKVSDSLLNKTAGFLIRRAD